MNIPQSITIGGFVWQVVSSRPVATAADVWGQVNYNDQIIYLDPDTTPQNRQRAFIHEVIHAINWCAGIPRGKISLTEEEYVGMVDQYFYTFVRDNLSELGGGNELP